jgi:hypothetical protein
LGRAFSSAAMAGMKTVTSSKPAMARQHAIAQA